jgi:hypothetical protein
MSPLRQVRCTSGRRQYFGRRRGKTNVENMRATLERIKAAAEAG